MIQNLLDLVEMEVRELLSKYEFDGDNIPIVKGSALAAVEGTNEDTGKKAILELMSKVDEHIPQPARPLDQDFLMPIEDVFQFLEEEQLLQVELKEELLMLMMRLKF